LISRISFLILK